MSGLHSLDPGTLKASFIPGPLLIALYSSMSGVHNLGPGTLNVNFFVAKLFHRTLLAKYQLEIYFAVQTKNRFLVWQRLCFYIMT